MTWLVSSYCRLKVPCRPFDPIPTKGMNLPKNEFQKSKPTAAWNQACSVIPILYDYKLLNLKLFSKRMCGCVRQIGLGRDVIHAGFDVVLLFYVDFQRVLKCCNEIYKFLIGKTIQKIIKTNFKAK